MGSDESRKNQDMEPEKFITVLTCTFAHEAAIVRGRLEAEGIVCFVKDEMIVQLNPFYSNAIGGVKLQVRAGDFDQVIEILKETGSAAGAGLQSSQTFPPLHEHADSQQISMKGEIILCPFCGSEEVIKSRKAGWLFLLTSLLVLAPSPFLQRTYYCFDCKRVFKRKRKRV